MICTKCGKNTEVKMCGLFLCEECNRPAGEFCSCKDEMLNVAGICGNHAICEKCGKAFPESMSE